MRLTSWVRIPARQPSSWAYRTPLSDSVPKAIAPTPITPAHS